MSLSLFWNPIFYLLNHRKTPTFYGTLQSWKHKKFTASSLWCVVSLESGLRCYLGQKNFEQAINSLYSAKYLIFSITPAFFVLAHVSF